MESYRNRSMYHYISSRELYGFRVRKRPCIADYSSRFSRIGVFDYQVENDIDLPLALSFCKASKNAHILAVTGVGGYVCLYNTLVKFSAFSTGAENAEKAKKCEWHAHDKPIYDVCWIKDDTNLLTAGDDTSIKLRDSQEKKCIFSLTGHTECVLSISPRPSNHEVLVSGSMDGSFALWDLRKMETIQRIYNASSLSVTSVLYMKDEVSIATAGDADSVVKFWDTRNLEAPVTEACLHDKPLEKPAIQYGISSLSQDTNGVYMSASCTDKRIYLFNVLQHEKVLVKSFEGCNIDSVFVKSKLSPDGGHLLSGSSGGSAYVWQVNKPNIDPIILVSNDGETVALDWNSYEIGKIATTTDDSMVQLWNINSCCY